MNVEEYSRVIYIMIMRLGTIKIEILKLISMPMLIEYQSKLLIIKEMLSKYFGL